MTDLTNSDIIAASSVAIASFALVATFWQAHIARKHNKLSVRPFMEHYQERFPREHISIAIGNHGLGPALLEKVCFITSDQVEMNIDDFLDTLIFATQHTNSKWETLTFNGNTMFSAGKVAKIINLELTEEDDVNFKIINSILDKTEIHIVYRCMYGQLSHYKETLRFT